jgi:Zn-dependent alcohol dehydrogenase
MTTTHFTKRDAVKVIEFAEQGKIDFKLGTAKVPLNQINEGFKLKREGNFLRILIIP